MRWIYNAYLTKCLAFVVCRSFSLNNQAHQFSMDCYRIYSNDSKRFPIHIFAAPIFTLPIFTMHCYLLSFCLCFSGATRFFFGWIIEVNEKRKIESSKSFFSDHFFCQNNYIFGVWNGGKVWFGLYATRN